jgi:hypothetical protein
MKVATNHLLMRTNMSINLGVRCQVIVVKACALTLNMAVLLI